MIPVLSHQAVSWMCNRLIQLLLFVHLLRSKMRNLVKCVVNTFEPASLEWLLQSTSLFEHLVLISEVFKHTMSAGITGLHIGTFSLTVSSTCDLSMEITGWGLKAGEENKSLVPDTTSKENKCSPTQPDTHFHKRKSHGVSDNNTGIWWYNKFTVSLRSFHRDLGGDVHSLIYGQLPHMNHELLRKVCKKPILHTNKFFFLLQLWPFLKNLSFWKSN